MRRDFSFRSLSIFFPSPLSHYYSWYYFGISTFSFLISAYIASSFSYDFRPVNFRSIPVYIVFPFGTCNCTYFRPAHVLSKKIPCRCIGRIAARGFPKIVRRKREFEETSRRFVERCSHTLLVQFQYYFYCLVSMLPSDFLLEPRNMKKKKKG